MKLGVIGGTFDPIHYGHLAAAEEARVQLQLQRVLFAPVKIPPHKADEEISALEHRLAMVELAIAPNFHFSLSRVDIDRCPPYYSVDAMAILQERWKVGPDEIYFIMGLDSLADILTWHRPERLLELCHLAVMGRPGYEIDLLTLEAPLPGASSRILLLEMPRLDISSSDLRRRVREGLSIKYLVPEAVENYVYAQHLYGAP